MGWCRVNTGEYFRREVGTVTKRSDGWHGSNSTAPDVDCEPTVGPLPSRAAAQTSLEAAMRKHGKKPRETRVSVRTGQIAVTSPTGWVRRAGRDVTVLELDLKSKYAEVEDYHTPEDEAPCVVLGVGGLTLRATRLKRFTVVSFPEFPGWWVYMADVSRYTLRVVLMRGRQ
jgi:hypothetical protein